MKTTRALMLNSIAGGIVHFSAMGYRLVQVPVLLAILGVEEYGRWVLLSSLPSLLSLANFGFGTASANDIVLNSAAGNRSAASRSYATGLTLVCVLTVIGILMFCLAGAFLPWTSLVRVDASRRDEMQWAVTLLAASIFLSFPSDIFAGRFRAAGRTHQSMLVSALRPWAELALMIAISFFGKRFDYLALASIGSSLLYLMLYWLLSRHWLPTLRFSVRDIDRSQIRTLWRKGLSFQGMAAGNAILVQGNLWAVQATLGPAAVAVFSTGRAYTGAVVQAMGVVNNVTWPVFTELFGKGDFERAAKLHRIGTVICVTIGTAGFIALGLFGRQIYHGWTAGKIDLPLHTLLLFMAALPITALFACSSVVHAACNQHEGLAVRYMLGTLLSVVACYVGSLYFGVDGAAASTVLVNLVALRYAFHKAIDLTRDTAQDFVVRAVEDTATAVKHFARGGGFRALRDADR